MHTYKHGSKRKFLGVLTKSEGMQHQSGVSGASSLPVNLPMHTLHFTNVRTCTIQQNCQALLPTPPIRGVHSPLMLKKCLFPLPKVPLNIIKDAIKNACPCWTQNFGEYTPGCSIVI